MVLRRGSHLVHDGYIILPSAITHTLFLLSLILHPSPLTLLTTHQHNKTRKRRILPLPPQWNPSAPFSTAGPNKTSTPPHPFNGCFQHFNYLDPVQMESALLYRDLELPFKITNVPDVAATGKKWTDGYLSFHFDCRLEPLIDPTWALGGFFLCFQHRSFRHQYIYRH